MEPHKKRWLDWFCNGGGELVSGLGKAPASSVLLFLIVNAPDSGAVGVTHADISKALGFARQTASRAISVLIDAGIISKKGRGRFVLHDRTLTLHDRTIMLHDRTLTLHDRTLGEPSSQMLHDRTQGAKTTPSLITSNEVRDAPAHVGTHARSDTTTKRDPKDIVREMEDFVSKTFPNGSRIWDQYTAWPEALRSADYQIEVFKDACIAYDSKALRDAKGDRTGKGFNFSSLLNFIKNEARFKAKREERDRGPRPSYTQHELRGEPSRASVAEVEELSEWLK